jgi:hypothetical protein
MRHIKTEPVSPIFKDRNEEKDRAIGYLFYFWVTFLVLLFVIAYLANPITRAHAEEVKTVPCEIWAGKRVFSIIPISKVVTFDLPVENATVDEIWAELINGDSQKFNNAIQNATQSLRKDISNAQARKYDRAGLRCKASNGTMEITITLHRE